MSALRIGPRGERGETLVELLVTIVILGIAAVAVLAGLMLSVRSVGLNRDNATGGTYVRSYAEAFQTFVDTTGYKPCSSSASPYASFLVPGLPGNYRASVVSVKSWDGSKWVDCKGTDLGIQRLNVKVMRVGADGSEITAEKLSVVLRKPCNKGAATAGADPC